MPDRFDEQGRELTNPELVAIWGEENRTYQREVPKLNAEIIRLEAEVVRLNGLFTDLAEYSRGDKINRVHLVRAIAVAKAKAEGREA